MNTKYTQRDKRTSRVEAWSIKSNVSSRSYVQESKAAAYLKELLQMCSVLKQDL